MQRIALNIFKMRLKNLLTIILGYNKQISYPIYQIPLNGLLETRLEPSLFKAIQPSAIFIEHVPKTDHSGYEHHRPGA